MIYILESNYKRNYFINPSEIVTFLIMWYEKVFNATIVDCIYVSDDLACHIKYYYTTDLTKTIYEVKEKVLILFKYEESISFNLCKILYVSEDNL